MENLENMARAWIGDWIGNLTEEGFEIGDVVSVRIGNFSKKYGCCKIVKSYMFGEKDFEIALAAGIMAENVSPGFVDDVIVHELIHTIPGCFNHGAEWKKQVRRANELFGLNISENPYSKNRPIEDQAAHENLNSLKKERKYIIECPCCHHQWKYKIQSKVVKNPEKYHCCQCKKSLVRIA